MHIQTLKVLRKNFREFLKLFLENLEMSAKNLPPKLGIIFIDGFMMALIIRYDVEIWWRHISFRNDGIA